MKKVFCWIFGIIFTLVAISSLLKLHYASFFFEALIALLLIPLISKYIKEKYMINIPKWVAPTTISLYLIFIITMGIINLYKDPFMKQAIKRSQEEASFIIRRPLPGITAEQKEAFENFNIEAYNLSGKIMGLKAIESQKLKEEKFIEYTKEIENLKVPKDFPEEVKDLLVEAIDDFSIALQMSNTSEYSPLDVISKTLDAQTKLKGASILLGITPYKSAFEK